jgi:hypothetical protein
MNLFASDEERQRVLVCSAAVALHALVSGRVPPSPDFSGMSDADAHRSVHEWQVKEAFAIAREFLKQAEAI